MLLPWQCLLSNMEYMDLVTFPGCSWTLLLAPLFNAVSMATQAVMLFIGECGSAWKVACFALIPGIPLCLVPLACLYPEVADGEMRFRVAMGGCLAGSFFVAGLFQSASSQLAVRLAPQHGPLPAHYSNGLGLAGLMAASVSGAATALFGQEVAVHALFLLCTATLTVSFMLLIHLVRSGTFDLEEEAVAEDPLVLSMCAEVEEGLGSIVLDEASLRMLEGRAPLATPLVSGGMVALSAAAIATRPPESTEVNASGGQEEALPEGPRLESLHSEGFRSRASPRTAASPASPASPRSPRSPAPEEAAEGQRSSSSSPPKGLHKGASAPDVAMQASIPLGEGQLAKSRSASNLGRTTSRASRPRLHSFSSSGSLQDLRRSPSSPTLSRRASSVLSTVSGGVVRAWPKLLAMFVVYAQTFLAFPAVCIQWVPANGWVARETYGMIVVSTFQVSDIIGRLTCTRPSIIKLFPAGPRIWYLIVLRMLTPALCILCWLKPEHRIFGSFAVQASTVGLHGLSQGVLTNLIFMWSSGGAAPGDRDVVGRAVPLCLCVGIVLGSAMSSAAIRLLGP